jgi:hypothetical protein
VGVNNSVYGKNAIALGSSNIVNGENAVSLGSSNIVNGENAVVFGKANVVSHKDMIVLGRYNDYKNKEELLFVIGNGEDEESRSNAFEVYKNGVVTIEKAPDSESPDNAVITKKYF